LIALFSLAALAALALQTSLPHLLPARLYAPDFILILAVDLGLRYHNVPGVAMAFGMGYATDAFAGSQLGLNALLVTMVFLLAYWVSRSLVSTSAAVGAIVVFVAVLIHNLGGYIVSAGWSEPAPLGALMGPALLQATLTAILTPWVFGVMEEAARMIGLRSRNPRE
jgi:rod shape-determining protein MreD